MGSGQNLPMNVTTEKSECDPKQHIRQLEVAIEHALAAAAASHPNRSLQSRSCGTVEVSYPSFEFRETLKTLRPTAGLNGIWVVVDLGSAATHDACKAASIVLQHYYPNEILVVGMAPVRLAS
jgi:hypothetical protein